jgi:hypothetical protein
MTVVKLLSSEIARCPALDFRGQRKKAIDSSGHPFTDLTKPDSYSRAFLWIFTVG